MSPPTWAMTGTFRAARDRKSTRLNSSHSQISYAVFCLKKKQLFPHAKIGFGPPIDDGFYYDFDIPTPFSPDDLEKIVAMLLELAQAADPFVREAVIRDE